MSAKWLNELSNNRRMKRKYPTPPISFMDSSLPPPQSLFLLNKQHSENISPNKSPRLLSASQRSDYFPLCPFSLREKYLEYFFSLGFPTPRKKKIKIKQQNKNQTRYTGTSTAENQDD